MLTRVQGAWHFRRAVPLMVRPFIGKQEIWFSMRTTSRVTATARAGMVYGMVEQIFQDCRDMSETEEYIRTLEDALTTSDGIISGQDDLITILKRQHELRRVTDALTHYSEFSAFIQTQAEKLRDIGRRIEDLNHKAILNQGRLAEARNTRNELTEAIKQIASMATGMMTMANQAQSIPPSPSVPVDETPKFSEIMESYAESKSKELKNERDSRVMKVTLAQFLEIVGDKPLASYKGKDAHLFIETMRRLPNNYGKNSITPVPVLDSITSADFQEKHAGKDIPRLSDATVEKRVTFLRSLWDYMLPIGHVEKNIWKGFKFKSEKVRAVEDWSEENLTRLMSYPWTTRTFSRTTYAFVTAIAAYSGMRQSEICHLRCEDFVHTDDGWMIYIQEHPPVMVNGKEVKFSPKSEAGERVVPIHSELIKLGLIKYVERMKKAGKTFIFYDLKPAGLDNLLSHNFQHGFSRHKIKAGVTPENVFHSFRHSVSTILRNEDATIREVWIDAVLGHIGDTSRKSQGVTTYLHQIGAKNLKKTINRIHYPESFDITKLFG